MRRTDRRGILGFLGLGLGDRGEGRSEKGEILHAGRIWGEERGHDGEECRTERHGCPVKDLGPQQAR